MATEPHIDGWVEVIFHYSSAAGKHANVYAYKASSQPSPTDCNQIASAFYTAIATAWKNCVSNAYNIDYIEVKTRFPVAINYVGAFYPTQPQPGAVTGTPDASNVALALSWKSLARGRSYQGRSFIGGFAEGDTTFNTVITARIVTLLTLATAIAGFTNSGGIALGFSIASIKRLVLTRVATVIFDSLIDSMRRRLTGRGQ